MALHLSRLSSCVLDHGPSAASMLFCAATVMLAAGAVKRRGVAHSTGVSLPVQLVRIITRLSAARHARSSPEPCAPELALDVLLASASSRPLQDSLSLAQPAKYVTAWLLGPRLPRLTPSSTSSYLLAHSRAPS